MPAKRADLSSLLHEAFSREAESVLRCLFYARSADVEGRADVAAVLRSVAEGEISQAFGHLEFLEESGDLAAVVETEEAAVERYGELAAAARRAGSGEAAEWFESLVAAEKVHLGVLRRAGPVGE